MWLDTGQLQQVSHWLLLFPSIILPQPQWPSWCSSNMPSMFLLWKLCTCCSFCLVAILLPHWCITDSSFWSPLKYHFRSLSLLLLSSWNTIPVNPHPLSLFHFSSDTFHISSFVYFLSLPSGMWTVREQGSLLYRWCLEQCLLYDRCSINVERMTGFRSCEAF